MPHIELALNELKSELLSQSSKIDQILSLLSQEKDPHTNPHSLGLNSLLVKVSNLLTLPSDEIKGKSRDESLVNARSLFVFFAHDKLGFSYKEIGSFLNRDHSSIISLFEKFSGRLKTDLSAVNLLLDLEKA